MPPNESSPLMDLRSIDQRLSNIEGKLDAREEAESRRYSEGLIRQEENRREHDKLFDRTDKLGTEVTKNTADILNEGESRRVWTYAIIGAVIASGAGIGVGVAAILLKFAAGG